MDSRPETEGLQPPDVQNCKSGNGGGLTGVRPLPPPNQGIDCSNGSTDWHWHRRVEVIPTATNAPTIALASSVLTEWYL